MPRKSKKHARRRARENALALLYSGDIMESDAASAIEAGRYPDDMNLSEYAESLVKGVCEHRAEIDERLVASSENWALDRMPVVDRAILRLAVYEMLFVDQVPVSVAINEAVELAKAYGGEDDSSRFVNGVLGRIARSMEGEVDEAGTADEAGVADEAADEAGVSDEVAGETAGETEEGLAEAIEDSADESADVTNPVCVPETEVDHD